MTSTPHPAPKLSPPSDRRQLILDASAKVLLRYGFRKASVDEVAQEAGISRQGLYLYFPTKDALFSAAIRHLLDRSIEYCRVALHEPGLPLEARVANAFSSMAGDSVAARLDELLEIAERLTGRSVAGMEAAIVGEFSLALDESPKSSPWRRNGDTAESVATLLYAASAGLKRLASSTTDYNDRMARLIRFICASPGKR